MREETITAIGKDELLKRENLPMIPEGVQKYLDMEEKKSEGEFFKIEIIQKSNSVNGHGIAYSNELVISSVKNAERLYCSGMKQYRGAYTSDIDDWDLAIYEPAILEETEDKLVYGVRTGDGNIYIFDFHPDRNPRLLESFNIKQNEAIKTRLGAIEKMLTDEEAFEKYVNNCLEQRWHIQHQAHLDNGNVIVFMIGHADRDYDAIDDKYKFYVLIKNVGIGISKIYQTGAYHPGGRFYRYAVRFGKIALLSKSGGVYKVKMQVKEQAWQDDVLLSIGTDTLADNFTESVLQEMDRQTGSQFSWDNPLFRPTVITESVINTKSKIAAWILKEMIDTDRCTEQGSGWLGDQYRYSVWKMQSDGKAEQIFEDHAYKKDRKCEICGLHLHRKKVTFMVHDGREMTI